MNPKPALAVASALAALALSITACSSSDTNGVSGEGSTAQQKAMEHFSDMLSDKSNVVLDYTGSGSGDGIKKFVSGDVDFAGSDSPLKPDEAASAKTRCAGHDAWHIPLVVGPVAISYKRRGGQQPQPQSDRDREDLRGTDHQVERSADRGAQRRRHFAVDDDRPVHRSDSSGTTDNFQAFLGASAPKVWTFGAGKTFVGKGGAAAQKSTGVGDTLKKTPGAIGYVEWGYATQYQLGVAKIDFGAGPVALTPESAGKALDAVKFKTPGSKDLVVDSGALFASKTPGAYPLLLTTYSIVCSAGYKDSDTSSTLQDAFSKIISDGQTGLQQLGYVPLPDGPYKTALQGTIGALTGESGGSA